MQVGVTAVRCRVPVGMTKPPAPKGVQRLHRVGARLAPVGKWPLEAGHHVQERR